MNKQDEFRKALDRILALAYAERPLEAECEQLERMYADALRDAERMQFCIDQGEWPIYDPDDSTAPFTVCIGSKQAKWGYGNSPREAIDAAMEASREKA